MPARCQTDAEMDKSYSISPTTTRWCLRAARWCREQVMTRSTPFRPSTWSRNWS